MKRVLLLLLAGVLSVGLAACGGGFAGYDPETTAQALLDSGAFEDALDTLRLHYRRGGGDRGAPHDR